MTSSSHEKILSEKMSSESMESASKVSKEMESNYEDVNDSSEMEQTNMNENKYSPHVLRLLKTKSPGLQRKYLIPRI